MANQVVRGEVGEWRVEVRRDPWQLVMMPAQGGAALQEAPAGPEAWGPVGFQTALGDARRRWRSGPWRQRPGPANGDAPPLRQLWAATSATDGGFGAAGFEARLATDHPDGWSIAVRLSAGPADALVVEATIDSGRQPAQIEALGQGFLAAAGERWLGFGERSDEVDRRDGTVEAYVGEGPYQDYEYEVLVDVFPPWALRQRADASYYPVPWLLSTAGYGVLLDNHEVSYHRLRPGGDDRWSLEVEADRLAYRVFPGPSPLEALGRFSEATGRQPPPGPAWWFGPWVQTGHANHVPLDEEAGHLAALHQAGAPVSAVETHCRYLPMGEHRGHEQDERARCAHFHAEGLATLSYLNPFVGEDFTDAYAAAAAAGALQRRADGTPYTFTAYAGGRTPPEAIEAQYDFTAPGAADAWGAVAAEVVDAGHDGWMEDFGEYTPFDAVAADGTPGEALHNRYPTDYHRAAAGVAAALEAAAGRPLARFVRSGWTGTAPWAPIVWGGDPTTGWGFDGLASAVRQGLSIGASGVAVWGSDTGGFFSSVEQLDPELLIRWIQFSALSPVMRTKSSGIEVFPYRRPQVWDEGILPHWRRWAALHTQLLPYLRAGVEEYRRCGAPLMRACGLVWPDVERMAGVDDQYLLGSDLLVAPVLTPGATSRLVAVPPGEWVELWSAVSYDPTTRGLRRQAPGVVHHGGPAGAAITLDAPLERIPVLVRAGARIDLLDPSLERLPLDGDDPPIGASLQF
ncbi:hypothetical protein K6U06_03600 [Acidiferrimicrobium sp. IK]|uniref:TIM-barrel domain-containing protein n=1 Tax=Acidiferrimicrobium sp. IK TaxID=2871700 RepID=UPI0021CB2F42|nr:TIM-barrel domain-containing protein [Acidiferrimicrobium sp. IK]MCU4183432.1 hypothetical protein [Acidiferrimicrobium sp. IK]